MFLFFLESISILCGFGNKANVCLRGQRLLVCRVGKGGWWVGALGRVGGGEFRHWVQAWEGHGAWCLLCFQKDKASEKMLRARERWDDPGDEPRHLPSPCLKFTNHKNRVGKERGQKTDVRRGMPSLLCQWDLTRPFLILGSIVGSISVSEACLGTVPGDQVSCSSSHPSLQITPLHLLLQHSEQKKRIGTGFRKEMRKEADFLNKWMHQTFC